MDISVCTVVIGSIFSYLDIFLHSLLRKSHYVREVIIVCVDGTQTGIIQEFDTVHNVKVKIIGFPLPQFKFYDFLQKVAGHALGLHHAIDQSSSDYVWLTDPDVFFYMSVDDFYLSLLQKYDLFMVGIGHFLPKLQCYLDFPCVTNLLIKKSDLPPENWLEGQLHLTTGMHLADDAKRIIPLDGKYLMPGLTDYYNQFPNPDGKFDVGCNLWLWNQEKQGKWISFQLDVVPNDYGFTEVDAPDYIASSYTSNFDLKEDLGNDPLLFHRTRCTKHDFQSYHNFYHELLKQGIA